MLTPSDRKLVGEIAARHTRDENIPDDGWNCPGELDERHRDRATLLRLIQQPELIDAERLATFLETSGYTQVWNSVSEEFHDLAPKQARAFAEQILAHLKG